MATYVGITIDPLKRKEQWKVAGYNVKNWKIIAQGLTYEQAQALENEYKRIGYTAHPGGAQVPGFVYSVYMF